MTPENKQRVKDAFSKALARDPAGADAPIPGIGTAGKPVTSRRLIGSMLETEGFYDAVDGIVAAGQKTLDALLAEFENVKLPLQPRIAPKP